MIAREHLNSYLWYNGANRGRQGGHGMSKRQQKTVLVAWMASLVVWLAVRSALEFTEAPAWTTVLSALIPLLGALPAAAILWQQASRNADSGDG